MTRALFLVQDLEELEEITLSDDNEEMSALRIVERLKPFFQTNSQPATEAPSTSGSQRKTMKRKPIKPKAKVLRGLLKAFRNEMYISRAQARDKKT